MTTLDTAITTLLSEYDHLDGVLTAPATGRRTLAMERVTGAIFRTITDQLDPYGIDDLDEQIADETLSCSLFLSSRLVGAMLDFREAAAWPVTGTGCTGCCWKSETLSSRTCSVTSKASTRTMTVTVKMTMARVSGSD